VVDLDVMGGDPVVEELGREHHVVTSVPEFGVVLSVELEDVTGADEAEAGHDETRAEGVHEDGRVVQGRVSESAEAGEGSAHLRKDLVTHHPEVVNNAE